MTIARLQLPQADRLSLMVALLEAVSRGVEGIVSFSQALSVTTRQIHYYAHAASFLRLIEGEEGKFALTKEGRQVLDSDPDRRFESIVGLALAHPNLADLLLPLSDEAEVDTKVIAKAIEGAGYGAATAERRAQTIVGWFRQAGLDLAQSLKAGCPIRDQLSIFDATVLSAKEEERPEEHNRAKEIQPKPQEPSASFENISLPSPEEGANLTAVEHPKKRGPKSKKHREPAPVVNKAGEAEPKSVHEEPPQSVSATPIAESIQPKEAEPQESTPLSAEPPLRTEAANSDSVVVDEAPVEALPEPELVVVLVPEPQPLVVHEPEPPAPVEPLVVIEPPVLVEPPVEVEPLVVSVEAPASVTASESDPVTQPAESPVEPQTVSVKEPEPVLHLVGEAQKEKGDDSSRVIPLRQLSLVPAPKVLQREPAVEVPSIARGEPKKNAEAPIAPEAKAPPKEQEVLSLREVLETLEDDDDVFGLKVTQDTRPRHRKVPIFIGVALRASLEPGRATILCRLALGEKPAALFREVSTTKQIVQCLTEDGVTVIAVAAPLWLPGEGIEEELITLEKDDPELWVARPWTRSPFVRALGFSRVELEGSSPGLAARGRCLREALAQYHIHPRMTPATQDDPGPRLIEVHPGLALAALANTAEKDSEKLPPGRRLRRAVEEEAGPVEIPLDADARHRDALAAAWTAMKFAKGAAWSPEGSSIQAGFVVVPFLG
jgi:hypothetical protein